ncbi:uncharacterized protein EKO05_0006657 [Ascochyta rabiei]|uniref:uncharacterized protein n=1 Tax=Didymella rabiei TaxID=5454 RepID=UPI00220C4F66|nr:uncharacterized protein EKO05_0006657 [Ascochyta rabiei]UPX16246.1 hypothetical protein EKO05_0006657 [Ascochyta rabiei]
MLETGGFLLLKCRYSERSIPNFGQGEVNNVLICFLNWTSGELDSKHNPAIPDDEFRHPSSSSLHRPGTVRTPLCRIVHT